MRLQDLAPDRERFLRSTIVRLRDIESQIADLSREAQFVGAYERAVQAEELRRKLVELRVIASRASHETTGAWIQISGYLEVQTDLLEAGLLELQAAASEDLDDFPTDHLAGP